MCGSFLPAWHWNSRLAAILSGHQEMLLSLPRSSRSFPEAVAGDPCKSIASRSATASMPTHHQRPFWLCEACLRTHWLQLHCAVYTHGTDKPVLRLQIDLSEAAAHVSMSSLLFFAIAVFAAHVFVHRTLHNSFDCTQGISLQGWQAIIARLGGLLHIHNILHLKPRLGKMPPKIPPAWPQNVKRHLALHDKTQGTSHLSDYLAASAPGTEDANSVMDTRIGELLDMRNAASQRRQAVIASAVEAGVSSVEAPASGVHMEAVGSGSAGTAGSEDPMVEFMPPLPSSTFKRLFKACKTKAKPQAIDLSDDEVLPSASVSSGQGGVTGAAAEPEAEASMATGGGVSGTEADDTGAEGSARCHEGFQQGEEQGPNLWQRMQSLKRQGSGSGMSLILV